MESKEVQSDNIGVDGIRDAVLNIRDDLRQLGINSSYMQTRLLHQHDKLQLMQDVLNNLSSRLGEYMNAVDKIERKFEYYKGEEVQIDAELAALYEERAYLAEEEAALIDQSSTQPRRAESSIIEAEMTREEKNELRLNDYARGDLYRKLQHLKELKERNQCLKMNYQKEWKNIKEDIKKYREERRPYELEIQNVNNVAISRFRGVTGSIEGKNEIVKDTIKHLQMLHDLKELRDSTIDLEILSKDFENDISELRATKLALLKQNENLEVELAALHPETEVYGTRLHRTSRHTDLPHRDDRLSEEETDKSDMEGQPVYCPFGGKLLHRCIKKTDISVPSDSWDADEKFLLDTINAEMAEHEDDISESSECSGGETKDQSPLTQDLGNTTSLHDSGHVSHVIHKEHERDTDSSADDSSHEEETGHIKEKALNEVLKGEKTAAQKYEGASVEHRTSLIMKIRSRLGMSGGSTSGTRLRDGTVTQEKRRSSLRETAAAFITRRQKRR